jgi:hypothetical protein
MHNTASSSLENVTYLYGDKQRITRKPEQHIDWHKDKNTSEELKISISTKCNRSHCAFLFEWSGSLVVFIMSGLPLKQWPKLSEVRSYFGGIKNDGLPMLLQGQRRVKPIRSWIFHANFAFLKCVCGFYWFCLDLTPWPGMLHIHWVVVVWLIPTSQC